MTTTSPMPDAEWGKRVHAIVQPTDPINPPTAPDLDAYCRERLAAYKVPKTYEFAESFLRTDAGKVRRSALVAERESGGSPAWSPWAGNGSGPPLSRALPGTRLAIAVRRGKVIPPPSG
jgi:acyl-CoA synthetase (AMP-forming)/AMP-acid ligase II